jgi:hypothetical protein
MKTLILTPPYINKRGKEAHKSGSFYFLEGAGLYAYGFDRIPRKLKKIAKAFCKPTKSMIWIFCKPDNYQLKDPSFMWLECFKTIL